MTIELDERQPDRTEVLPLPQHRSHPIVSTSVGWCGVRLGLGVAAIELLLWRRVSAVPGIFLQSAGCPGTFSQSEGEAEASVCKL